VSTGQADPQMGAEASEQELREAYEAEMQRVTSADMLLQAAVSLLNVGGYRLGLSAPGAGAEPGAGVRDLEQVRDAIDGVRALLPVLERARPQELRPLRDALSQLQMAYAREAGAQAQPQPGQSGAQAQPGQTGAQAQTGAAADPGPPQAPGQGAPAADTGARDSAQSTESRPGPAESSGRLWVPGR